MEEFILFVMSFIFIFIIYEIFIVSPAKKRVRDKKKNHKRKDKNKNKELFEIMYLKGRYRLNMEKINYNQLLQICAIVSSLDIALIVTIMGFIDNFILKILGALVFTVIVILLSYHLVYVFYKKKGMINNE